MKIFYAILGSMLVAALSCYAQEEEEEEMPIGAVCTKNGVVAFSNWENDFFTFQLKGKKSQVRREHGTFVVNLDGRGIQFNVVSLSDFLSSEEMKNKNDSAVLWKHMNFERSYFEEHLKTRLNVKAENKKCGNGRAILVWSFKMPEKKDGNVKKQLFVSTRLKSHVLVLNGIILKESEYKEMFKILENGMSTLLLKDTPINPEGLEDASKDKD
jgi:hypothetical protein